MKTKQHRGLDATIRFFVDQYNAEFNRGIHPMKGGYTDNYYMQMAHNIRKYKGVRPIPELKGFTSIKINGTFDDWNSIETEYRDTKGDTFHRDHNGYGGLHYTDNSGRNDIITSKVCVDKNTVSFYTETNENMSNSSGNNWMLLFMDTDKNPETGWYGYDYVVNKKVKDNHTTILMSYNPENFWEEVSDLEYSYDENKLELSIPRELIGLLGNQFTFDFKWSDNAADLKDPISFCTHGDTAPNRRFNYRFIWEK